MPASAEDHVITIGRIHYHRTGSGLRPMRIPTAGKPASAVATPIDTKKMAEQQEKAEAKELKKESSTIIAELERLSARFKKELKHS
jgi:hypothetical protein